MPKLKGKPSNPNRITTKVDFSPKEELTFKDKRFLCKIGIHECIDIYNGMFYILGCKHCHQKCK